MKNVTKFSIVNKKHVRNNIYVVKENFCFKEKCVFMFFFFGMYYKKKNMQE